MSDPATQVFRLTNAQRTAHHRRTLKRSNLLDRSARAKARQLAGTGTLAHGLWWKLIWKYTGHMFDTIGENIADGQNSAPVVAQAWLDSPAHRDNILATKYTHLGVGHTRVNGVDWWVQHFGGK